MVDFYYMKPTNMQAIEILGELDDKVREAVFADELCGLRDRGYK